MTGSSIYGDAVNDVKFSKSQSLTKYLPCEKLSLKDLKPAAFFRTS